MQGGRRRIGVGPLCTEAAHSARIGVVGWVSGLVGIGKREHVPATGHTAPGAEVPLIVYGYLFHALTT